MSASAAPASASGTAAATAAATSAAATWDAGVTAPWMVNEEGHDLRAFLCVATALAASFVIIGYCIRSYVRLRIGGYQVDDHMITAASLMSMVQFAVTFVAINKGFGQNIEDIDETTFFPMLKAYFSSILLYIITLYLSKLSTVFTFLRITPNRNHLRFAYVTLGVTTAWFLISLFLVAFACHPSSPYEDLSSATCSSLLPKWSFITALSIATELSYLALSVYLVHDLHLSSTSKLLVLAAFGARTLTIVPSAVRLFFLSQQFASDDPTLVGGAAALAAAELEIGYSLLAATVPCLKPFISTWEGPYNQPTFGRYTHKPSYRLDEYNNGSSARGSEKQRSGHGTDTGLTGISVLGTVDYPENISNVPQSENHTQHGVWSPVGGTSSANVEKNTNVSGGGGGGGKRASSAQREGAEGATTAVVDYGADGIGVAHGGEDLGGIQKQVAWSVKSDRIDSAAADKDGVVVTEVEKKGK